jgi:ribosomal protein S27E
MAQSLTKVACPRCLFEDVVTDDHLGYRPRLTCEACGAKFSYSAGCRAWVRKRVNHDDVDRSDLIDPDGKYAIIRPDSQSGHSPSTRYKTQRNAETAAVRLCEAQDRPAEFEVVRIVARVTTRMKARIERVR